MEELHQFQTDLISQTESGASIEVLRFTVDILADRYKERLSEIDEELGDKTKEVEKRKLQIQEQQDELDATTEELGEKIQVLGVSRNAKENITKENNNLREIIQGEGGKTARFRRT